MTTQQITFLILPCGTATLTLPEFLTPDTFAKLDSAIHGVLTDEGAAPGDGVANDPAAIEFDSWLAQLH